MLLGIRRAGDPVLRRPSRPLTTDDIVGQRVQDLIASMRETMRAAPGVGLAAPQIGESVAVVVIEDREEYIQRLTTEEANEMERVPIPFHVLVNPRLHSDDAEIRAFFEGCLSVPGFRAMVPRARRVHVDALDDRGRPVSVTATGWYARILQHEIDHLEGRLYLDRMRSRTFTTEENFASRWKGRAPSDILAALGSEEDST